MLQRSQSQQQQQSERSSNFSLSSHHSNSVGSASSAGSGGADRSVSERSGNSTSNGVLTNGNNNIASIINSINSSNSGSVSGSNHNFNSNNINSNNNCNGNTSVNIGSSSGGSGRYRPPLFPKPKTPSFDKDRDYIGFATLPEQVHRKSVKRGFEFTLMVVGESGLGKSTLINSLFLGDLYKNRVIPNVEERLEKTTRVEKKTMDIEERGVRLRLTVVDTPGFGDGINCEDSWRVCTAYIDEQFRQYFTDESGLNRRNIQDNRVHCCLYFVPPWGHSLRQMDLDLIRRLHRKVNIVLVIAKADCLTKNEVHKLKERILQDLEDNKIQLYQFPECDSDEDEDFKQQDRDLKASIPFAVVGSNTILEVAGKKVRGRQYPWGVVDVEDPEHSDFNKLRTFLISTHMQDLKDTTQDVHYENFRAQCISQISQHALRERGKLKRDSISSTNGFDAAISETDRLLLQKDEEIRRMQDMLTQMQEKLKQTHLMEMKKNDSVIDV